MRPDQKKVWECRPCGTAYTEREKGYGVRCWQGHNLTQRLPGHQLPLFNLPAGYNVRPQWVSKFDAPTTDMLASLHAAGWREVMNRRNHEARYLACPQVTDHTLHMAIGSLALRAGQTHKGE